MKLHGQDIPLPQPDYAVFPRGEDSQVVFKIVPVLDFDTQFEKLCPRPEAPLVIKPGDERTFNYADETFLKNVKEYSSKRINYLTLLSITEPNEITWEKVDLGDPETWKNYHEELKSSGFNDREIVYLLNKVLAINSLSTDRLDEARKSFLATLNLKTQPSNSLTPGP